MELKAWNILYEQLNSAEEELIDEVNHTQSRISQTLDGKLLNSHNLLTKDSIIRSITNGPEREQDFRRICSLYENQSPAFFPAINQIYDAYNHISSLYFIENRNNRIRLTTYNTECEEEEIWNLDILEQLDYCTCIAQLPNSELFCFGNGEISGITLIIDINSEAKELPSGKNVYISTEIFIALEGKMTAIL